MSGFLRPKVAIICCSVLRAEVESLCEAHWPDHRLIFLPSMMHMRPERLASSLESVLDAELKQGHGVVLIYGDCCARMTELEALPGVVRTRGKNCCELLLGLGGYRRLSHEGVFFLLPEWARRWREIFSKELGLNRDNATSLMQEMHRKLMYLDTGLAPVPAKELIECAEYCGLPYEVLRVSLGNLYSSIVEALFKCKTIGVEDEARQNEK
jgi:hypothetical protein